MEPHTRRWLLWTGAAVFLLISLVTTMVFLAYWYVLWPISPKWVAVHSPWTAPQVRALAIVHRWGTDLDMVHQCQSSFAKRFLEHRDEAEAGVLECMRAHDPNTRFMAYAMVNYMKRQAELSPQICAEIVRGIEDPDASPRSSALGCVAYLPSAQSQPIFTTWLHTSDLDLNFRAVDGLAKPGAFELTEIVLPWLRDEHLRYNALQFLVRIRDPAATGSVRTYADDPNSNVREQVRVFLSVMSSAQGGENVPAPR